MTNSAKKVIYRVYAFLVYLIPMVVLFFVRMEKYMQVQGALGIFGFILLVFVFMFFGEKLLDKFKEKRVLFVSVGLFVFAITTYYISSELLWITATSVVGAILSEIVNVVGDVYARYEYKMVDGVKTKNKDAALSDKDAWREAYGFSG